MTRDIEVRKIMMTFSRQLFDVFKSFCLPGKSSDEIQLDFRNFVDLLKSKGIFSENFSEKEAALVFHRVQILSEDDIPLEASELKKRMTRIGFEEFMDCVIAITLYLEPNPYIPVEIKLKNTLPSKFLGGGSTGVDISSSKKKVVTAASKSK